MGSAGAMSRTRVRFGKIFQNNRRSRSTNAQTVATVQKSVRSTVSCAQPYINDIVHVPLQRRQTALLHASELTSPPTATMRPSTQAGA